MIFSACSRRSERVRWKRTSARRSALQIELDRTSSALKTPGTYVGVAVGPDDYTKDDSDAEGEKQPRSASVRCVRCVDELTVLGLPHPVPPPSHAHLDAAMKLHSPPLSMCFSKSICLTFLQWLILSSSEMPGKVELGEASLA